MKKRGMVISRIRAISQTLILTLPPRTSRSFCSSSSSSPSFALKNVTKSNFESSLLDLRRHVRDADFVAIDLEMTGVTSAPWRESFDFDRFDIRYLKVKDSAEKFAVVQFGVCPFRWDASKKSFIAQPHNFYIFPRQEVMLDSPSYDFLCQTASIDFLAKYQFDFNACINEGISYLSRAQEAAARIFLSSHDDDLPESSFEVKEDRDIPLIRMTDILFTERMKKRIHEWLDALSQTRNWESEIQKEPVDSNQQFETIFFKMRPALKLNGFTSHQLRLIKLVTEKYFQELAYVRVNDASSSQQLIVYTDSTKDRKVLMKEVKDSFRDEAATKIEAAVGFRQVIDLLSSERKSIVGHNCFLDIAHIYSKFVGPLPLTLEEYVASVHNCFPSIIDTKILLNANMHLQLMMKKSSTSLSKAFAILCPQLASGVSSSTLARKSSVKVEVQVDEMRSSNWNSGAKHEAGYDAFMTGCVFAQACSLLDIDFNFQSTCRNLYQEEKLQKHINLLYLSWTSGDVVNLKTGKLMAESSAFNNLKLRHQKILFPNIILIWGFPSKLTAKDIKECLCKVFGTTSVTSVYHLDGTAVFVQFSKATLVSDFLEVKATIEKNNDPIYVLHPLSKLLEGGNTCAASYEVYKEICGSPISRVLFAEQAEAVGIKWKTKTQEPAIMICKENGSCIESNSCNEKEELMDSLYLAEGIGK